MRKICVIGHFAFGKELLNGQTIKTKIITNELERQLGKKQVLKIDTHGGKKMIVKQFFQVGDAMRKCENVVMLPAHNGVRFFSPLLCFYKHFFHKKIHYVVIGGWLPDLVKKKKKLYVYLKKFDGIYVETTSMKKTLEEIGFKNIYIMPNCKRLNIVKREDLIYSVEAPYRLCTFSRVTQEKGIEDAINAVINLNNKMGRTVFLLDIYGQIEESYKNRFKQMQKTFPNYVHYCGCVAYDQTTNVLKKYFALLFPTRFFTEGIPGTVIDAYAAGVPVIASRWESFNDVIKEQLVGIGYEFGNNEELIEILKYMIKNVTEFNHMKEKCVEEAKQYLPERCIKVLIEQL